MSNGSGISRGGSEPERTLVGAASTGPWTVEVHRRSPEWTALLKSLALGSGPCRRGCVSHHLSVSVARLEQMLTAAYSPNKSESTRLLNRDRALIRVGACHGAPRDDHLGEPVGVHASGHTDHLTRRLCVPDNGFDNRSTGNATGAGPEYKQTIGQIPLDYHAPEGGSPLLCSVDRTYGAQSQHGMMASKLTPWVLDTPSTIP